MTCAAPIVKGRKENDTKSGDRSARRHKNRPRGQANHRSERSLRVKVALLAAMERGPATPSQAYMRLPSALRDEATRVEIAQALRNFERKNLVKTIGFIGGATGRAPAHIYALVEALP